MKLKDLLSENTNWETMGQEMDDLIQSNFKGAKPGTDWSKNFYVAWLKFKYKPKTSMHPDTYRFGVKIYWKQPNKMELDPENEQFQVVPFKDNKDLVKQLKKHFTAWKKKRKQEAEERSSWSY